MQMVEQELEIRSENMKELIEQRIKRVEELREIDRRTIENIVTGDESFQEEFKDLLEDTKKMKLIRTAILVELENLLREVEAKGLN